MARQKKRLKKAKPQPLDGAVRDGWDRLKAALDVGLEDGTVAESTSAAYAEALRLLLADHEDIAATFFHAGFTAAMSMMHDAAQMAMAMIPHDCGVPGHNHGPAQTSKIGRA